MKEIVDRLNEQRQIEVAKNILKSKGYSVSRPVRESRRVRESTSPITDSEMSKLLRIFRSGKSPVFAQWGYEDENDIRTMNDLDAKLLYDEVMKSL